VTLAREYVQREELKYLRDLVTTHWYNETFGRRDINVVRDNILEERKEVRRLFKREIDPESYDEEGS